MKTIHLILLLFILTACSQEEETMTIETTSVNIITGEEQLSRKNVQRGNIFGSIKDITVLAQKYQDPYNASTTFTLTNNATDATAFVLDNVAIGSNTFSATTTTGVTPSKTAGLFTGTGLAGAKNEIARMNNTLPYATYTGETGVQDIRVGVVDNVPIALKTNHSRFIAYILCSVVKSNPSGKEGTVDVTPYIDGVAGQTISTLAANQDLTIYWSDTNSVNGKTIYFHIVGHLKGANSIVIYDTPPVTLVKSTTHRRLYEATSTTVNVLPVQ
jgi:hypothetical protein